MRNALAHAGKSGRRVVSAFIATAFAQDDTGAAKAQWRQVADQVRPKLDTSIYRIFWRGLSLGDGGEAGERGLVAAAVAQWPAGFEGCGRVR